MKRSFVPAVLAGLTTVLVLVGSGSAGAVQTAAKPTASKVLFFTSDGMRPDLMEQFAAAGKMPTYANLLASGIRGANGLTQGFPPNTGVGWYTLATGTWPSEHGSTNNTFHRTGAAFTGRTGFADTGVLQADTLQQAAERSGKKVAQIEWVGGRNAGINGPTVDFRNFFSTRGVLTAPAVPEEQAGATSFGLSYQVASFADASGWTNVPASTVPAKETTLTVATTFSAQNPTRVYDVYVYAAGSGYDHVLLTRKSPTDDAKNGSKAVVNLAVGDFKEIKLKGADGLIGARAGQTAGFYVKLIDLAGDLSKFKLYFASVARAIATCGIPACAALPGGNLEEYIANNFPTSIAADFAPLEARIIDEETYVEQGLDLEEAYVDPVLDFILGTLQPDTDLAFVGFPVTDEFSHQFMGLVTPTEIDGSPNPYFDDLEGNGTPDGRIAIRQGFIEGAYRGADALLARARSHLGASPAVFASSDHGFVPQHEAVNARRVLFEAKTKGVSLQASGANTASNCGAATTDLAKACWAGGTIQIYVNPSLPSGITYEDVRTAAIDAFRNLSDPAHPGRKIVDRILKKEELRNVDGSDSLHPNRSGDVVVVLFPPYQSDAGTPGQKIAFSQFFGQHGYLPNLVDLAHNVNMHGTFVAAGPGVKQSSTPIAGVRAIDLAPTIAFLMGIPGPQQARGKILFDTLEGTSNLREVDILDISDYHGQLVPLTEASDPLLGSASPIFAIGGAAFLKPWFDAYRADNPAANITVTAGDAVGATPPISSFFGDKPTIELMNSMGFNLDGLGNHNFDRGEQYLRNQLIPLAKFKYVSANVLDSRTGDTPPEWSKSRVVDFGSFKLAVIGFTNPDAPELVKPGSFGPFVVSDPLAAVNKRAEQLGHRNGVAAIVAIGHLGATAGTLTAPTGPLVDLADNVKGVDAVIGDHTDFQVLTTRSNGVLVTENRSKGIRFTRVRLVVDTTSGAVVYKTADFHRPWNIGVTPDPQIQARIDQLNAQLAPILNTKLGDSTKAIPRTDQCGNTNGRTCESLVGNVTADSMRTTYGTNFAVTNSGGLRADLTCPAGTSDPNPNDFCPASLYPIPTASGLWPITRGQVLTVLPFGNQVVTLSVTGAELKAVLENGVSQMPAANGRFPQVSGLCFTYDITAPAGSRVLPGSVVVANADGSCAATPVNLTATATYTLAENDFMVTGGDGYPNLASKATSRDLMDQVLADYITASTPISPAVRAAPNGRINCTGTTCPPLVASP